MARLTDDAIACEVIRGGRGYIYLEENHVLRLEAGQEAACMHGAQVQSLRDGRKSCYTPSPLLPSRSLLIN